MQLSPSGVIKVIDEKESLEDNAKHVDQSDRANILDNSGPINVFRQEVDVGNPCSRHCCRIPRGTTSGELSTKLMHLN